ncbi:hypothetical protein THF1C08_30037 [Vibrio jasicida]|uniref:Uncharacterized protein n=1 Tax=Vibrio jasicida TaxID=766224 RepID=A0AAU9QRW0_9VIBR|nr:hypothetical protein THF1C08_30037 [Vibrio jasicida]CAH1600053.1 hypothetical protein THF1A12_40397 [Vibrio jasicida]
MHGNRDEKFSRKARSGRNAKADATGHANSAKTSGTTRSGAIRYYQSPTLREKDYDRPRDLQTDTRIGC